MATCDAICGWEHIYYMRRIRTNREWTGRSLVQRGGLEIPCMYDVFVKTERTYRAEEDFERETAFFQATRRWNSLVRCLTVHDHRMNVKYVIKCYGKVRIHYKLNQHYGMLQY